MNPTDFPTILLLFDIDGTLISTDGRAKDAMLAAAEVEFHRPIRFHFKDFAGSTDRRIIRTLMEKSGIRMDNGEAAIDRILHRYLEFLAEKLTSPDSVRVYPGVRELLERLHRDEQFALGLLTGNVEKGARLKLAPPRLNRYFPIGAFGCDEEDRTRLPAIAIRRAEAHYRRRFSPERVWIIGDTPRDIRCGKVNHLRTLAVATGGWTLEQLQAYHPDVVVPDFQNVEQIVTLLKEGSHSGRDGKR
ncbi:MAG: HAD family hydrolase [Calditrichaeota bacterium]|nr:MAG: HAD family hydrolase [Calditrichota bacterium]